MNDHDDNRLRARFAPVIAGLEDLGRDIAGKKFPGVAWKAPAKRRAWKVLLWPAAGAAAAAAVLLAAIAFNSLSGGGPKSGTGQIANVNAPLEPREDDLLVMEMLVRDAPEFDWTYHPTVEEEYDWWMNEVSTSKPAVDI